MDRHRHALLLVASAATISGWLGFIVRVPVLEWVNRPLPFQEIHARARWVGPFSDTMLLLLGLLGAYLVLAWIAQASEADLPVEIVVATAVIGGVLAMFTYSVFAEDAYVVLANVWSFARGGVNPYAVEPNAVAGNPYQRFIGWGHLQYVYGPVWLLVGGSMMRLVGPEPLPNALFAKGLHLGLVWLMGAMAWRLARARGERKPVARAALVLWNPLLLIDGVMTPHLDLPMAAAALGAVLAWTAGRHATVVALLALSVLVKFITVILGPAVMGSLLVAGAFRGRQGRRLWATVGVVLAAMLLISPWVWEPFARGGLRGSLELVSHSALFMNLVMAMDALGILVVDPLPHPLAAARDLRWVTFVPVWLAVTAACVLVTRRQKGASTVPPIEGLALLLLGYHTLFTVWVLPWHFLVALTLCLVAPSRAGFIAGLLITASAVASYVNGLWVWDYPWQDERWVAWIFCLSLLSGPLLGMALLGRHLFRQTRALSRPPTRRPRRSLDARGSLPASG